MLTSVHAHGGGSEETPQVGPRPVHRWHAHGGGSEVTPQVGPRCTDGMRMEEVVRRLLKFGPGAQMAKMDITKKKKKKKKKGHIGWCQCTHRIVICWVCSGRDSTFQCIGRWSRMDGKGT